MKFNFVFLGINKWLNENKLQSINDVRFVDDRIFKTGKEAYILKTFKIMQNTTLNLTLSESLEKNAINIIHRDDFSPKMSIDNFIICARVDREPAFSAQVEILQNGLHADGKKRFFITHWPIDGIIPRDPKSNDIKRLSFFGKKCHVSPELNSEKFKDFCEKHGLKFTIHEDNWTDYHSTDVVIALRDGFPFYLDSKASHKLVNSWIACVPAILNPEYGYKEIINETEDAIFVNSLDELIKALKAMLDSPEQYIKIVNNGKKRANEFSFEKISKEWETLLKHIEKYNYPRWKNMSYLYKITCYKFAIFRSIIWGIQVTQYPNTWLRNIKSYIRIFIAAPILCIRHLKFHHSHRLHKNRYN
ncbi:glycosyltransferase [Desulfosarcina ovata]|uniref:Glycosyl transferase family 1 domain-containing protein n=1 Tax=Desulfosarcina ovata subsp. ovata TaxID=2752305 RepID=A0A5K8A7S6_9BACT|nr:glycosyltransferase [Desulfosarcina ovata]BBO88531.1 hypothetical protein DSCOOX_17110 [Desulfosarcina ovata subsp. ovata]